MPAADLLITHIAQLATPRGKSARAGTAQGEIHVVKEAAIAVRGGKIIYAGPQSKLPRGIKPTREINGRGQSAIPAFIDSHTHLPFLGNRRDEFLRRLAGESYLQIAQSGGGIIRSVGAVRAATVAEIEAAVARRLKTFREFGVLTVEAKSGYGLDLLSELKQLRALRTFRAGGAGAKKLGVEVVPTFMGAHAVPREFRERRRDYIDLMIREMLPAVAREKLAEFCDIFCEQTAFTRVESARIAAAAKKLGLRLKLHADELTAGGGAALAARLKAVSAEHLIHADGAGMRAMARAGTVAVLLPGTSFFLGEPYAPARKFVAAGVPVAVATDCNPGSAHSENLQNVMMLALMHAKLTPAEILTAVTLNGAAALNRAGSLGSIESGKQADFLLLATDDWRDLYYHWGVNPVARRFKAGKQING